MQYCIALGECGDSVTFSFDAGILNIKINRECCPVEDFEELLKFILRGQIILADKVGLPEAYRQMKITGYPIAHPIDNQGNYLVNADGRLLYADGPTT